MKKSSMETSMNKLDGKTAFITGAAGGIGRDIAYAFAAQGAVVGMADNNAPLLREAVAGAPGGRGQAFVCDVADRAAVHRAVNEFAGAAGGLDILVNNAVFFHYGLLTEMPEDIVDKMIDVGYKGALWSLQAATPHMIARGGGSVINLSSIAVSFSIKNASVYTSIKGALDALTRQQAVELGVHGIRVNALAPGPVATPGSNSVIDEQGWESRRARTPLGRLAGGDEVGAAAVFLASDDARSIAGVTLKIDAAITVAGP
jgi:NAD(P)-dependent dehydrogenase (short-subunit alcohol dehydrogenase family)